MKRELLTTHGQRFHSNVSEFCHFRSREPLRLYDLLQRGLKHLATQGKFTKAESEIVVDRYHTCVDAIGRLRRAKVDSERWADDGKGGKANQRLFLFALVWSLTCPRRGIGMEIGWLHFLANHASCLSVIYFDVMAIFGRRATRAEKQGVYQQFSGFLSRRKKSEDQIYFIHSQRPISSERRFCHSERKLQIPPPMIKSRRYV